MSEIVMFRQDYVRFQESTCIFVRSMVGDPYFFTLGLGPLSCVDAEPRLQRGGPDHLPTAGQ